LNEGQADVAPGPAIDVTIALAEGIELSGDTRVFVAVRNAEREGMPPLAATQLTIAELPTTIRLDDADAVGAFNLSSAETVYVTVLVSFAGSANPQSGDYRVVSNNFAHNGQHTVIELTVSERIP
jgi:cytochrome c-type biogenesis protein CcmH